MDDELFNDSGIRAARRRERHARRRRLLLVLAVVLVAAAALAGFVLAAAHGSAGGAAGGGPSGPGSLAAVSPAASSTGPASPVPSPTPTPAPLDPPTAQHPYRVYFGGDSLAGLPGVLFAQKGRTTDLMKVRTDYQVSSRLTNPDPVDWPEHLRAELRAFHPDIAVFMIGINDPGMPMIAKGTFTMYPKKTWLDEYRRRADRLMRIMLDAGVERVYWVGLPVMPGKAQTSQVKRLNALFRSAAGRHPDVVYVDTFGLLADGKGRFVPSLRSGDGVHFTDEGAWRIANAVWAAIKKDWRRP